MSSAPNGPELSEAAFIPDPLDNNSRLYKTGDLCKKRPDGSLDNGKRADHALENPIAAPCDQPLQGRAPAEQLEYWRRQLEGAPERLELPTDFPRPAPLRHREAEVQFDLEPELASRLRVLAQRGQGTFFMVLAAAFNIILHRYSGQRDICLGTLVANRPHSNLAGTAGVFLNTVVLRTRIGVGATFGSLLGEVQRTTVGALANQETPFEYLAEQLQPRRSLDHHPLFQVMLNLVSTREEALSLEGLRVGRLKTAPGLLAMFDMSLSLTKSDRDGWEGRFAYNAELFSERTMTFLSECFLILLRRVVEEPDAPLAELSVLGAGWAERVGAVCRPRPTGLPVRFGDIEQSIPQRFAEQVLRHPQRMAVRGPGGGTTYAELDREARRVAAEVLAIPAAPRVAVLLSHDASIAVGLLGVLMAGRAYVPLDPAQPASRLAYILADTGVSILVCTRALRPLAEKLAGNERTLIELEAMTAAPLPNLPVTAPGSIAYVLYTSGSTGLPKGVIQSHRNVLHFMREYTENLALTADDRLIQVASYAFDAGVMDIFGALLNGATLYPVNLRSTSPEDACAWLAQEEISILHVTPTVFRVLTAALTIPLPNVRLVVLGGEAALRSDVEAFRRCFSPECLLVNGLGPTESTVTLQFFLDATTPVWRPGVPVGYPVGNTEVVLRDAEGETTELYGEIVIRSAHVALGYWGLESDRFSDDPHHAGKRLYRTGDLARLLPDGSLESLGRRDGQVKLRGFRIELGEIEAVLRAHPGVREAAVTLFHPDDPAPETEPQLAAYVCGEFRMEELKAHAWERLPEYMVPRAFVELAGLPRSVNGKLDRRALPKPATTIGKTTVPPRNAAETKLVAMWEKVLAVQPIGVTDNFFELGGNSLTAVRLFMEVRRVFGSHLPLSTLFQAPTAEQLAQRLAALNPEKDWAPVVAVQLQGNRPPFFGIHAGLGDVLFYRALSRGLGTDQPFYGIQSQGLDGKPMARTSMESIAAYYCEHLRKVQPHGPYLLGGYSFGGLAAYEIARLLRAAGEEVALLALFDTDNPARPPRLRSYTERIRNAVRNPAAFRPDRILQFLARRMRGKAGDVLLRVSEAYRRAAMRLWSNDAGSAAKEAVDVAVVTVHQRAALAYRPLPYDGKLVLLRALDQGTAYLMEPDLGWGTLVGGAIEIYDVPGDHWSLFEDENIPIMAKVLEQSIHSALLTDVAQSQPAEPNRPGPPRSAGTRTGDP
ncbi:MAG TPA: amino acid adenylation domain-containing protein [Chthoniobacterales bacterium]